MLQTQTQIIQISFNPAFVFNGEKLKLQKVIKFLHYATVFHSENHFCSYFKANFLVTPPVNLPIDTPSKRGNNLSFDKFSYLF